MQEYEFMEVDDDEFLGIFAWIPHNFFDFTSLRERGLPQLDSLKSSKHGSDWQSHASPSVSLFGSQSRDQISLIKQAQPQPRIQLQPDPVQRQLESIRLPGYKPEAPHERRQQTNEPVCPQEFSPAAADVLDTAAAGGSCDSLAPSLDGFDDLPGSEPPNFLLTLTLAELSAEDVEKALPCFYGSAAHSGPHSLDLDTDEVQAPSVPLLQDQETQLSLLPRPTGRQRTITLMSDTETSASQQHDGCLSSADDTLEIYHQLMDEECELNGAFACEHSVSPARTPTCVEHRQFHDTAKHLLELHQELSRDIPQAKKKPMLHEFLGYILFCYSDARLGTLRGTIFFCDENGQRLQPPKEHFRVANFQAVSEVWRLIKCNSSKDCTKNMKRAMRMSTTNDRQYFVNLSQRMHRMQVFKFGERSLEYFRKMFPGAYRLQRRISE